MKHFHVYLVLLDINFVSLLVAFSHYFYVLGHSYPIHLLFSYMAILNVHLVLCIVSAVNDRELHYKYRYFYVYKA